VIGCSFHPKVVVEVFFFLWRKSSANIITKVVEEGFVGVCLEWGVFKHRCVILNVYSKCDLDGQRRLWEKIVVLKREMGTKLGVF